MIAWRLEQFETLDSTSDYCIKAARAGATPGLAVLAANQTAGRGSRGRNWQSSTGNLHLSVLLRPSSALAHANIYPLLAGIAVSQACTQFLPRTAPQPMLKWPNDVLLNGSKLAGLLIDASLEQENIAWLVIGIGVNLAFAPEITGRATTCLAAHGVQVAALKLAEAVLAQLATWLGQYAAHGAPFIQQAWLEAAHALGTKIQVQAANGTQIAGSFAGLSPQGALLLRVENRTLEFQTGEIMLELGMKG